MPRLVSVLRARTRTCCVACLLDALELDQPSAASGSRAKHSASSRKCRHWVRLLPIVRIGRLVLLPKAQVGSCSPSRARCAKHCGMGTVHLTCSRNTTRHGDTEQDINDAREPHPHSTRRSAPCFFDKACGLPVCSFRHLPVQYPASHHSSCTTRAWPKVLSDRFEYARLCV